MQELSKHILQPVAHTNHNLPQLEFSNRSEIGYDLYYYCFLFIASMIEEGAIGNFVKFKSCVFEENMATEYGGAVGLILPSANIIFDNRDNIRPITFDSW